VNTVVVYKREVNISKTASKQESVIYDNMSTMIVNNKSTLYHRIKCHALRAIIQYTYTS